MYVFVLCVCVYVIKGMFVQLFGITQLNGVVSFSPDHRPDLLHLCLTLWKNLHDLIDISS